MRDARVAITEKTAWRVESLVYTYRETVLGRAFNPYIRFYSKPGASPQAGIGRAVGRDCDATQQYENCANPKLQGQRMFSQRGTLLGLVLMALCQIVAWGETRYEITGTLVSRA